MPNSYIDSIRLSGTTYQIQGEVTVDAALDSGSTNPVANSAITTALDDKQATLVSSQNIKTINNESILGSGNIDIQGGGGKAIEAGRGIAITTGETADTVSFSLPISAGTGTNSITEGESVANGDNSHAEGNGDAEGNYSHAEGSDSIASGFSSHAEGQTTKANGISSHAEGSYTTASGNFSHAEGMNTKTTNQAEHASGKFNVSSSASTTFGDSGNTLFSVGNGTSTSARHNAFEIRQNGDIYLTKDGQDVKLQDHLGGGGTQAIELTQAQYDALVDKDPNVFYIITDAEAGDLTNYYTKSETSGATQISTALASKQDTLQSGTNIKTINNESILGSGNIDIQGGGKAVTGGTNISITTGETADTINCTLPISADTRRYGTNLIFFDNPNTINHNNTIGNFIVGFYNTFGNYYEQAQKNFVFGNSNNLEGYYQGRSSSNNFVVGSNNFFGSMSSGYAVSNTAVFGQYNKPKNNYEFVFGQYNNSVSASTTFGDSGNTLFSVGNGTADNARHNAFEIRQNGDIYLSLNGQDVKLQDQLGGGGSSYTAGDGIDITNDVISVTGKADTSAVTAIQDSLSGYVTTNTDQTISGKKVFTYTSTSGKAIEFKQTSDTAKVGFRVINSAATNNELASFEFRPNTFTVDGVQHPLLYFGHYRNTATANAGVPQTVIGFRQYDQKNGAAYHYLMPLPEKAKTPFGLTTTFKDYYAPMGFKNGSTMIKADNTGVVDLSSELGGLKLKKLTQAEYDALATKDSNTLYVIVN